MTMTPVKLVLCALAANLLETGTGRDKVGRIFRLIGPDYDGGPAPELANVTSEHVAEAAKQVSSLGLPAGTVEKANVFLNSIGQEQPADEQPAAAQQKEGEQNGESSENVEASGQDDAGGSSESNATTDSAAEQTETAQPAAAEQPAAEGELKPVDLSEGSQGGEAEASNS